LSPYKITQIKIMHKNACTKGYIKKNQSIFFNFKHPLLYIWCIYVILYMCVGVCLLLQVNNLNLITNLALFLFYGMLIAWHFAKNYIMTKKWMTLPFNHLQKLGSNSIGWLVHFTFKCEFNGKSRIWMKFSKDVISRKCVWLN
jgi:hypothetical protein